MYATPSDSDVDYNEVQGGAGATNTATGEYKLLNPAHATNGPAYEGQEALGRSGTATV